MNILLSHLAELLKAHYHVATFGDLEKNITEIALLDPSVPMGTLDRHSLHVVSLHSPAQLTGRSNDLPVLCVVNPDNPTVTGSSTLGAGITVAVYARSFPEVLMTLSTLCYQCGEQSSPLSALSKELLGYRTIEAALEVGYRWLQNPLLLADRYQRILVHCHVPSEILPEKETMYLSRSTFPGQQDPAVAINAMELSMRSAWPNAATEDDKPMVRCKTLSSGGEVLGYLFCYGTEHPLCQQDDAILDMIGSHCTLLLREQALNQRTIPPRDDPLRALLRILLDEQECTRDHVEGYIEKAGLKLKPFRYILAVAPGPAARDTPVHGMAERLSTILPGAMATYYQNTLTMTIETDRELRDFDTAWPELLDLLKEYGFRAGISNLCRDILDLKTQFFQAKRALTLGRTYFPQQPLVPYFQCATHHILELAATYHDPLDFCDPAILQLQKLDNENNSNLLETLETYLLCRRSKSLTAQKLYLHPNTVRYRLGQISEILPLEDSTVEEDFRLYQSILLLRFQTQPLL